MFDFSTLYLAAKCGHEEIVAMLMESVKSSSTGHDKDLFYSALRNGYDSIASQLLAQSPHLADTENSGMIALHFAANYGCQVTVLRLLAARPDSTHVASYDGKTVLNLMAECGFDTIVARLLVEKPHSIDVVEHEEGWSVLHFAAKGGHGKVVAQLLAARPELASLKDAGGYTAFYVATLLGRDEAVAQFLATNPPLANLGEDEKRVAFDMAACFGRAKVVARLLDHSPGLLDAKCVCGRTALESAICSRLSKPAVAYLLAQGAAVDAKMLFNMFWRRYDFDDEVMKLLLAHKPELIQSVDDCGNTLLHRVFSAYTKSDEDELFEERVFRSEDLMRAIWQLYPEALHMKTNKDNETPLDVAFNNYNHFAIELVQWQLFPDELSRYEWQCPQPLIDHLWEALAAPLPRDVAWMVWDYIGGGELRLPSTEQTRPRSTPQRDEMI